MASMQDSVGVAVGLLPPEGSKVEFNAYKSQLYSALPENGKDVFAHMIKANLINKELDRNDEGAIVVMLSRKAQQ